MQKRQRATIKVMRWASFCVSVQIGDYKVLAGKSARQHRMVVGMMKRWKLKKERYSFLGGVEEGSGW